jgi:HAMP domain-containing protein
VENLAHYIRRRLVWVLVFALIGGLLGFAAASREKQTWVAQSLVVLASDTNIPTDSFADAAAAIFPTETVLGEVITKEGLDATPRTLITSGALALQPTPGGLAVRVIAQSQESAQATQLANDAATSLATASSDSGFGTTKAFTAQDPQLQPKPTTRYVAAGLFAGALLGVAIVVLWYLLRVRPRQRGDVTTPNVTVRVRVEADAQRTITPATSLTGLWFGFVSPSPSMDVTGIMVDEGNSAWAVTAVADELSWLAANDNRGAISWRAASEEPDGLADRVVVLAPAGMSARIEDVRREITARAPNAFMAFVLVVASGPN